MNGIDSIEQKNLFKQGKVEVPFEFKHVISHFYYAQNNSLNTIKRTLFPSFQSLCIFNFKSKLSFTNKSNSQIMIDKYFLLDPVKQAIDYLMPPNSEILVLNFKDDAFYRFFGASADEIDSGHCVANKFYEHCFTAIWQEIEKLKCNTERIDFILDFCRPYLSARNQVIEPLLNARNNTADPIKMAADFLHKSVRHIQVHHKKYFGFTAKELHRYQRFLKTTHYLDKLLHNNSPLDWLPIALSCGYYDQSHFIRDFKYYLNCTPSQYISSRNSICT